MDHRLWSMVQIVMSKKAKLSPRLEAIVSGMPLKNGMRVLEIGCGSGAAARAVAQKIGNGHVLAIDRSEKSVNQAKILCREEIKSGRMTIKKVAIENFTLEKGEKKYDIAFALRVGALDGRHPQLEEAALIAIKRSLHAGGRLFVDGEEVYRP
jgi:cyclopropane fatty-acyl-phospholipid synthase-like methyltransferase